MQNTDVLAQCLGFTFTPSGKKHKDIKDHLTKLSKAWFMFKDDYLNRKKRHWHLLTSYRNNY